MSRTSLAKTNDSSEYSLIEEEYSLKYLRLLGYEEADKNEILRKLLRFEIQKAFRTRNFYNSIIHFFVEPKDVFNDDIVELENIKPGGKLLLRGKDENIFTFLPTIWEENWSEQDRFYKKMYIIPNIIGYLKDY